MSKRKNATTGQTAGGTPEQPLMVEPVVVSMEKLREPRFSHADTLYITGLTSEQLLTWHKRGVLANIAAGSASAGQGRGIRKKYCFLDLWYLTLMKELTEACVPLVVAALRVVTLTPAFRAIVETRETLKQAERHGNMQMLLVVYRSNDRIEFDLLSNDSDMNQVDVHEWMRGKNIRRVAVIDLIGVYIHLMAKVLERR